MDLKQSGRILYLHILCGVTLQETKSHFVMSTHFRIACFVSILLLGAVSNPVSAQSESTVWISIRSPYSATGETIAVDFSGAEHARDWIGIYEPDVQPTGDVPSEAWLYVNGSQSAGADLSNGTVRFTDHDLAPGRYKVWFLADDGYEPLTDPIELVVGHFFERNEPGTNREPEILTHINEARSQGRMCGNDYFGATSPVAWDEDLEAAALVHSNDMAENVFRGHTGSDGSIVPERIQRQTDRFTVTGEVLSYFYPTLESAVEGWLGSPGHCRVIMGDQFTHMGGAIDHGPRFDNPSREGPYRTAVFGGP